MSKHNIANLERVAARVTKKRIDEIRSFAYSDGWTISSDAESLELFRLIELGIWARNNKSEIEDALMNVKSLFPRDSKKAGKALKSLWRIK